MLTISIIAFIASVVYLFYCMIKGLKLDVIGMFIVFNVITALSIQHFPEGATHTGFFRIPLAILVVVYFLLHGLYFKRFSIIIITSLYFILLSFVNTSNILVSVRTASGLIVSLFMFPIAFKYINTNEGFLHVIKYLTFSVVLIIMHYAWANIYGIGRSPYLQDFFFTGGASIGPVSVLVFFLLIMPLVGTLKGKFDIKYIILTLASLIIILLLFRRGAVFGLALGFLTYTLITIRQKKTYIIASISAVLLIIVFAFFGNEIKQVYEARDNEAFIEGTAGRAMEVEWVMDSFKDKGFISLVGGIEAFNSGGYFHRERNISRSLHTDYMVLLHGTGIIGVILMIGVYFLFFRKFKKTDITVFSTYYSILFASLIMSYSGLFLGITSYSLMMILLGGLNRISYNPLIDLQNGISKSENQD